MDIREIAIETIGLSVRANNALQKQNVVTVGQLLEYTEDSLYSIRNLGTKTVDEILAKIEEYRNYAEKNELPVTMISQENCELQTREGFFAYLDGKELQELSIDEIGLSVRAVNALHMEGVITIGQLLEYTEERLYCIRNLGKKTVTEIWNRIIDCKVYASTKKHAQAGTMSALGLPQTSEAFFSLPEGKEYIKTQLCKKDIGIECLDLLPARAYNLLFLRGYTKLHQIVFMTEEELLFIPRMDSASAHEICLLCDEYLQKNGEALLKSFIVEKTSITILDMVSMPEYKEAILQFVKVNDRPLEMLGLSTRPINQLKKNGCYNLSDIVFLTKSDLLGMNAMGENSVEEVLQCKQTYLLENEKRLMAYCTGDESDLFDDETIRYRILDLYQTIGFNGLSLDEMLERLKLPESITVERVKRIVGRLLTSNELEYVDFRCYRVYPKFSDCLPQCTEIDDRSKRIIQKRLNGETLESIAQSEGGLTRERIRQIEKTVTKLTAWYERKTGLKYFDEDYYRYFYCTYSIDRDAAATWLGIPTQVFRYLDLQGVKCGKKPIDEALSDPTIDAGLRLKIKNYINRNRLYIDGRWIVKKRADLEEAVARKCCQSSVSFTEYIELFNAFLIKNEIPYDDKLYYTSDVINSRRNRIADARFILWSHGEMLRYYDIDSRDYAELFDTLGLDGYEDVEISTLKLMDSFPDIMKKYDIRDHYELHNLLKKVIIPERIPSLKINRMPMLVFGQGNRSTQLLDLIINHSPCTLDELQQYAKDEYGYDAGAVTWSDIVDYYHNGVFTIDQKVMHYERKEVLKTHLVDDFYYFDEIKKIYNGLFPDGDEDEINSYNLRQMGFVIRSRCAVKNFASLDGYFTHMMTKEDIVDISETRKRFSNLQSFSQTIRRLQLERQIIEYEPNQFINIRKLQLAGVTHETIQAFCDAVWDFVSEEAYFSACSLRQDGFYSELYDLGFSDWFYASLLSCDDRFSFSTAFGCIILYKGESSVSTQAFESSIIRNAIQIDAYDLQNEMEEHYGCKIKEKFDLVYKVQGTEIYYDRILDRFYANEDAFERELDRAEEY